MTGGRLTHERMLDVLEQVISRPVHVSVLAMHKSLVVLRHLLLYGADQVLAPAKTLDKHVLNIAEKYNTAVIAQEATGATGFFMRLKGGAVDKGGPAREVAKSIIILVSDPRTLQFERNAKADPDSLVPVGSKNQVGFITDQARHAILQRRMEKERQVELKSNLAKSDSAFGSGYNSKDGKAVVGAAHSLEEMIKVAEKKEQAAKRRFTDAPKPQQQTGSDSQVFCDYQAPSSILLPGEPDGGPITADLLAFDSPNSYNAVNPSVPSVADSSGVGDLLDMQSSAPVHVHSHSSDLLGPDFALTGAGGSTSLSETPGTAYVQSTQPPQSDVLLTATTERTDTMPKSAPFMNMPSTASSLDDPFASLDVLSPPGPSSEKSVSPQQAQRTWQVPGAHAMKMGTSLDSPADLSASLTPSYPAPSTEAPALSAVRSSLMTTDNARNHLSVSSYLGESSDACGSFVMGGLAGSGLEPVGAAPSAPPPPPPP